MFRRKKGLTVAQTKRTSRRMQSATIGSHVRRYSQPVRRNNMNADAVRFANQRKKRRAARGMVDNVPPPTQSGESEQDYTHRINRREFTQEIQRKARMRRTVIVAVAMVMVVCVAVGVGAFAFLSSVDSKLSLNGSNATEALKPTSKGEPFYLLCAADLGLAQGAPEANASSKAYVLARVDESASTITVMSIPSNLRVKLSDGSRHPLYDAETLGGDAALIEAVASFAGVDVSYFARTDADGIAHMVEEVGGVVVDVAEEVDDPVAGDIFLGKGEQAIHADAALTLLRASNYIGGAESQSTNRNNFFSAIVKRMMESSGLGMFMRIDAVSEDVQTNLTTLQLSALADALRSTQIIYTAVLPGYASPTDDKVVFVFSDDDGAEVMNRVRAGEDPTITEENISASVNKAAITVAVRNGTNVSGSAATLTGILLGLGYQVTETGNTDDNTTYPETLIIYQDPVYADAAKAIVSDMEAGRVVNGGSYYAFETNVLVIIGIDWQPIL